jgi:hypothetical protein
MPAENITIGSEVYTSNGDKLGTVKDVRGDYFKVDAAMQPDYWLACDCIRGGSVGSRVTVMFDKDHLGDYKKDIKD